MQPVRDPLALFLINCIVNTVGASTSAQVRRFNEIEWAPQLQKKGGVVARTETKKKKEKKKKKKQKMV